MNLVKASILLGLVLGIAKPISAQLFDAPGQHTVVIPNNTTVTIRVIGADGGLSGDPRLRSRAGGSGATMAAAYDLLAGDILTVYVGGHGDPGGGDSRSGGGGGGGSAVILNQTDVLIVAAGGGGASRSFNGGPGLANTNSTPGGGTTTANTWAGGGGGGFNATGQNTAQGIGGGGAGTLTGLAAGGAASTGGGGGGLGWSGGGGAWFQGGGGGGGYKGGDGSFCNTCQAFGGDSFISTSVRNGLIVSNLAGLEGGGRQENDGLVCIGDCVRPPYGDACGCDPPLIGTSGGDPVLGNLSFTLTAKGFFPGASSASLFFSTQPAIPPTILFPPNCKLNLLSLAGAVSGVPVTFPGPPTCPGECAVGVPIPPSAALLVRVPIYFQWIVMSPGSPDLFELTAGQEIEITL